MSISGFRLFQITSLGLFCWESFHHYGGFSRRLRGCEKLLHLCFPVETSEYQEAQWNTAWKIWKQHVLRPKFQVTVRGLGFGCFVVVHVVAGSTLFAWTLVFLVTAAFLLLWKGNQTARTSYHSLLQWFLNLQLLSCIGSCLQVPKTDDSGFAVYHELIDACLKSSQQGSGLDCWRHWHPGFCHMLWQRSPLLVCGSPCTRCLLMCESHWKPLELTVDGADGCCTVEAYVKTRPPVAVDAAGDPLVKGRFSRVFSDSRSIERIWKNTN